LDWRQLGGLCSFISVCSSLWSTSKPQKETFLIDMLGHILRMCVCVRVLIVADIGCLSSFPVGV
jgi:hypothetical protein